MVLEARHGLEALLTSVQHRGAIDLLMTDLDLSGISGTELGWAFNELWPESVLWPRVPRVLLVLMLSTLPQQF